MTSLLKRAPKQDCKLSRNKNTLEVTLWGKRKMKICTKSLHKAPTYFAMTANEKQCLSGKRDTNSIKDPITHATRCPLHIPPHFICHLLLPTDTDDILRSKVNSLSIPWGILYCYKSPDPCAIQAWLT